MPDPVRRCMELAGLPEAGRRREHWSRVVPAAAGHTSPFDERREHDKAGGAGRELRGLRGR